MMTDGPMTETDDDEHSFLELTVFLATERDKALTRVAQLEAQLEAAQPAIRAWNDLQAVAERLRNATHADDEIWQQADAAYRRLTGHD